MEFLHSDPIVRCSPKAVGSKKSLDFSIAPPLEPGVYIIYLLQGLIPFYVGESKNLKSRLTFLFRCNSPNNPHPCHKRHQQVWSDYPQCEEFCGKYGVRWLSTVGAYGSGRRSFFGPDKVKGTGV